MISTEMYTNKMSALDNEFCRRFAHFQKVGAGFDIAGSTLTTEFEKSLDDI